MGPPAVGLHSLESRSGQARGLLCSLGPWSLLVLLGGGSRLLLDCCHSFYLKHRDPQGESTHSSGPANAGPELQGQSWGPQAPVWLGRLSKSVLITSDS